MSSVGAGIGSASHSGLRQWIVVVPTGHRTSSKLLAIAARQPSVELTGWVPDVRPYLAEAEVVVVPLRTGGGTRIKIPEAMAMAKAIVSTPIGAEGLPFRDGRELLIAERPEDFVGKAVDLPSNASLRDSMGRAAREEVASNYSWTSAVDRLEQILERAKW